MALYKPEKRSYENQERYDMSHCRHYSLKLNIKTDGRIIVYLRKQKSMQGAIKKALVTAMELDAKIARLKSAQAHNHRIMEKTLALHKKAFQALSECNFEEHQKIMKQIEELQKGYQEYDS